MPTIYCGMATLPCHGSVDTGVEVGVCGLWHFQRWCACLAYKHKLRPQYIPLLPQMDAGGIRGAASVCSIADMPMGVAGISPSDFIVEEVGHCAGATSQPHDAMLCGCCYEAH